MNKLKIFLFLLVMKICTLYLSEERLGSRNDDFLACTEKDEAHCSDVKFTAKGFQCCKYIVNQPQCGIMVSPIKSAQDEVNTENGKILYKEYFGYSIFKAEKPESIAPSFDCPDGKLNFKYGIDKYSTEEQQKLKSQKHCLKINDDYSETITKDICHKADLATTGNSGVSCGYYEFNIVMTDNSTYKHQTCFLYDDDIRTTKNIGYAIKQMAEMEAVKVASEEGKELLSYQMNGTNSDNKYFMYDSVSDTVSASADTSDGTALNISFINSGYIFLLILFYIWSY